MNGLSEWVEPQVSAHRHDPSEAEFLMPTLLRVGPYQFFIVMFDCAEQMHVHVKGGGRGEAKSWLVPEVSLAAHRGYTARDLARIEAITREHRRTLRERWLEVCEGGR